MITIILPYLNSLEQMRDRTIEYFNMINDYINHNKNLQLIISDYGSNDDLMTVLQDYKNFDYVYTKPNKDEYFNISKCNNNALMYAKNDLIFTNGVDWRYNYNFLEYVWKMFAIFPETILEPSIVILAEDNQYTKFIHTNIIPRKYIIEAGGWEERIFNWGQEDHDLIEYIFYKNKITKIRTTNKDITILHLWHEDHLYDLGGGKERNALNVKTLKENLKTNRKNMINTYWYNEKGVLKRKN